MGQACKQLFLVEKPTHHTHALYATPQMQTTNTSNALITNRHNKAIWEL